MNIIKEIEQINNKLDFLVSIFKEGQDMTDLTKLQKEVERAVALAQTAGAKLKALANTSGVDTQVATLQASLNTAMTDLEAILGVNTATSNATSNAVTANTSESFLQKVEAVPGEVVSGVEGFLHKI
jgi:hypothetical protein